MELSGEQTFSVGRDLIWDQFFDPAVLEQAIPGANTVERTSQYTYHADVTRGLGAITVNMDVTVEVVDDERPRTVKCELEGVDNRTNSSANGEICVDISESDEGTVLRYEAEVVLTGKIASMGSRLIKRQVDADLQTFFKNIDDIVSGGNR